MLNLLEFLPDGGAERYAEYGTAVAPILESVGGRPVFAARPAEDLIGEGRWDLMVVVEYPTRQAFLDMVSSSEYQAIAHLRTEALRRSELRAMDSFDGGGRVEQTGSEEPRVVGLPELVVAVAGGALELALDSGG
jgi:uncharacterized protein (DUF1330 family)